MLVDVFDKLHEDLGIRLALEDIAFLKQVFFEHLVVFNDAVVDHRKPLGGGIMRVGIHIIGLPVGGPTRVTDAYLGVDLSRFFEELL